MSYTLISTQVVGVGGSSTISFNSIPQIYTDLYLVFSVRTDYTGTDSCPIFMRINGTSTGYSNRSISYADAFGVRSAINQFNKTDSYLVALATGTGTSSTVWSDAGLTIFNYANGSNYKVMSGEYPVSANSSTDYSYSATALGGYWSNTGSITSLSFTAGNTVASNFLQNSIVSLYGVNQIPTASLGTTPTVDYLVVAGGGGSNQGGGGGGGLLTGTNLSVPSGSALTVTVGAGGVAGSGNGVTAGGNGANSVFYTVTAVGGGGGGNSSGGVTGGSGGGSGQSGAGLTLGGSGTSGQGYAGGTNGGFNTPNYPGGGGGGAGGVGGNAVNSTTPGNGGIGAISTINGYSTYYAGGGAGGLNTGSGTMATGGLGGGGNGNVATGTAYPGINNTGGGAGGTGNGGAQGGSGIVIIRYPQTYNPPSAVVGNPAVSYINGYRVYTWTNSGSITF